MVQGTDDGGADSTVQCQLLRGAPERNWIVQVSECSKTDPLPVQPEGISPQSLSQPFSIDGAIAVSLAVHIRQGNE